MKGEVTTEQSAQAVTGAVRGGKSVRGSRRAERMIAANVTNDELAVITAHAKRGGYNTLAEYVRAVCISPMPKYDTDAARISRPLVQIGDRIRRVLDVLDRNETDAVRGYLDEMRGIIHAALTPFRREHDEEIRARA